MKASRESLHQQAIRLNSMGEHDALHVAENALCAILESVIIIGELKVLRVLQLAPDSQAILDIAERMNDRLAETQVKYEHPRICAQK